MAVPDIPFKAEKKQIGVSLTDKTVDVDLISNGFTRFRQFPVETHGCIQQPIGPLTPDRPVDAEVGTEKQVRLSRLYGYAYRHPVAVQVPCIRQDIMFSDNMPGVQ